MAQIRPEQIGASAFTIRAPAARDVVPIQPAAKTSRIRAPAARHVES
jgi:hypothetical protein